jgi:membrane protease YdiL (CAAX protease family)
VGAIRVQPVTGPERRVLVQEIWLVLALSLGASGIYALLDLIHSLSVGRALNAQTAVINNTTSGTSFLDLVFQLLGIAVALVPVFLVGFLLARTGESLRAIGLDTDRPAVEFAWGAGLAAVVGGIGLGFYLLAFHLGFSLRVVPTSIPAVWWRIPVLLLSAVQNGALEEIVVCGYLLHRLAQLGWNENTSLVTSAAVRGSYHLYQGFGGFVANFAMGLLFGRLYQRQGRLARLVIAHSLIDAGAFVGYVLLKGRVSWIP